MENKRYNLRGGASNNCDTEVGAKETVSNDDTTLETSFKKPDLANITIAQLMPQLVMAGNVEEEPTGSTIENCETKTPVKKTISRNDKLDEANLDFIIYWVFKKRYLRNVIHTAH